MVRNVQRDLDDSRTEEIEQQRANLENYRTAERESIKAFIEQYEQQAAAGQDMEISIRNQRQRLEQLEERIEERKADLDRRARIISVAPEVEAYCLTLPV
jgi:DNA-binding transcriptional regulator YbjK